MASLRACSIPIIDVVKLCGEWITRALISFSAKTEKSPKWEGNHRATLRSWSVQSMAQNSLTTSKTGSNLNRNRIMFRLETPLSCPSMRFFLVQRSKLNLNEISRNIFLCCFLIPSFTSSIRGYNDEIWKFGSASMLTRGPWNIARLISPQSQSSLNDWLTGRETRRNTFDRRTYLALNTWHVTVE